MSSLFSLLDQPGRVIDVSEGKPPLTFNWKDIPPAVKKINLRSFLVDVEDRGEEEFATPPCPTLPITPPFNTLWFEGITPHMGNRFAIFAQRVPICDLEPDLQEAILKQLPSTTTSIHLLSGVESAGYLMVNTAGLLVLIDESGKFASGQQIHSEVICVPPHVQKELDKINEGRPKEFPLTCPEYANFTTVLHALARMNCANVTLQEIPTGAKKQKRNPHNGPPIVWHEIVVREMRRAKGNTKPSGESVDTRLYWVRGHFGDYTKGNGLFGNPELKKVFWFPEHQRGNENVGEVIASYTIEGAA